MDAGMGRVIPLGEKTSARLMYSDTKGIAMAQAATLSGLCGLAALALIPLSAPDASAQTEPEAERACVRLQNINGYETLDDRHLVLNGGANRHYLVTTRRSCYGLDYGAQVGLSFPETTRICNASLEYIIVPDGGRCRISTIEEVDSVDAARALITERASGPAQSGND